MSTPTTCARRAILGCAALLAACAAPQPKPVAPLVQAPAPLDASYDWHVLLVAPFGSVLKDVPLTLHEVLLFRDQERSAAAGDELECYAVDGPRPRFIARSPTQYLLCFRHERLSRVEATVRLAPDEAAGIFADACGLWLKNAQTTTAECAGTDGGTAFSGHFENEPDESARLTVELDAPDPPSDRAPDR